MFDIGFWEMTLIALVALVVLGPERLPRAARTVGLWVNRARRMLGEVKADIDREIRNAEIKEMQSIKKDIEGVSRDLNEKVKGATKAGDKVKEDLDIAGAISDSAPAAGGRKTDSTSTTQSVRPAEPASSEADDKK